MTLPPPPPAPRRAPPPPAPVAAWPRYPATTPPAPGLYDIRWQEQEKTCRAYWDGQQWYTAVIHFNPIKLEYRSAAPAAPTRPAPPAPAGR